MEPLIASLLSSLRCQLHADQIHAARSQPLIYNRKIGIYKCIRAPSYSGTSSFAGARGPVLGIVVLTGGISEDLPEIRCFTRSFFGAIARTVSAMRELRFRAWDTRKKE